MTKCPEVDRDLSYKYKGAKGSILRCYDIDRDATHVLFTKKLKTLADR